MVLTTCAANLAEAERLNPWFKKEFIELRKGSALALRVDDNTIGLAGQNCLFNIFKESDLKTALQEIYRVLKPGGRLVMFDPICNQK